MDEFAASCWSLPTGWAETGTAALAGKSLCKSGIREKTGCNVLAVGSGEDMRVSPGPDTILRKGEEIVLIGTTDAERVS